MTEVTASELVAIAEGRGAVAVGIADAAPFPEVTAELQARVDAGLSGGLGFTFRDPVRAGDVRATHPWARRFVAVAVPYPMTAPVGEGAVVARFAVGDAYASLRRCLTAVADRLRRAGHRAEAIADDAALVDRAVAVRAGVGWWGKSTMVLVPGLGPWVVLGAVVTDAALPTTEPMRRECGRCVACLPACPTGALVAPGVLDARRCLAAVLQRPGTIPVELRAAVGARLYGCDDCLVACPPGRRALARAAPVAAHDVIGILGADDRSLLVRFGHFYLPGRNLRTLRRNALVVAGNVLGRDRVAIVAGFLGYPDPLLRSHAAWAVGRIGGRVARAALRHALRSERDPGVRDEIESARGREVPVRAPAASTLPDMGSTSSGASTRDGAAGS